MKFKRIAAILLALTMVLSLAACGATQSDVWATVGDYEITEADVDMYLDIECLLYGMDPTDFDQQEGYLDYVKELLLSDLVDMKVMKIYCDENEIEALTEGWETDYESFLTQIKGGDGAADYMKQYKITDANLKEYYENNMVRNAFAEDLQNEFADLGEKARAYYEEHVGDYVIAEGASLLNASHILVVEEATAQEVLDKLKAGESFEELAAEYGTDGTASTGGALGPYEVGSSGWDADFEAAALELAPGETSGIVATQFGFHIIRMNDKLGEGETKPFENVQKDIENTLLGEAYTNKLADLREKYGVEIIEREAPPEEEPSGGDGADDGQDPNGAGDGENAE